MPAAYKKKKNQLTASHSNYLPPATCNIVKKVVLCSIPGMFIAVWSLPGFMLAALVALLPQLRSLRDVIALITTVEGVGKIAERRRVAY